MRTSDISRNAFIIIPKTFFTPNKLFVNIVIIFFFKRYRSFVPFVALKGYIEGWNGFTAYDFSARYLRSIAEERRGREDIAHQMNTPDEWRAAIFYKQFSVWTIPFLKQESQA